MLITYGLIYDRLLQANLVFDEEVNLSNNTSTIFNVRDVYRNSNLSATFGIGFDRKISEEAGFRLKTIYRYGLFSAQKKGLMLVHEDHLWSLGLNVCFYFKV